MASFPVIWTVGFLVLERINGVDTQKEIEQFGRVVVLIGGTVPVPIPRPRIRALDCVSVRIFTVDLSTTTTSGSGAAITLNRLYGPPIVNSV